MRDFRKGLTLTELVVLLSIASLILAIGFPTLQQNREAARNEVCKGNLQTIGLAALEYEAVNGQYPPYLGSNSSGDFDIQQTFSLTLLLPFLGQQALVDQIDPIALDFNIPNITDFGYQFIPDWINNTSNKDRPGISAIVFDNQVDLFRCPSDILAEVNNAYIAPNTQDDGGTTVWPFNPSDKVFVFAITNYTTNAGALAMTDTPTPGLVNAGWLGFHGPIRSRESESFDSIADGAANVVLFGESLGNIDPSSPFEFARNIRFSSAMGGFNIGRPDVYAGAQDDSVFGSLKKCNRLQFGSPHPDVVNTIRADGAIASMNRKNTSSRFFGRLCGVEDGNLNDNRFDPN